MKIIYDAGMVTIIHDAINYGNIEAMYKREDGTAANGAGLQINSELEINRDEIGDLCDTIANTIYKLNKLLTANV